MRRMTYFVMALAMVLGLAQCKKEQPTPQTQGVRITLTVDGGNSNSRVIVDPTGHTDPDYATVTFETGDVIYVGYKNAYVGSLTYSGGTFSGSVDISESDYGEKLHFYFLGGVGFTPTVDGNTATVVISDQSSRYPVISYSPSKESFAGEGSYSAKLQNKVSIMKFDVTTPSSAAICITGMNNKVTLNFNPETEGTDEGFTYGINTEDGGLIKMPAKDESNETWAIVLPQGAYEEEGAEGTVYSEDHSYTGKRPVLPAIQSNKYLADGIAMTVTTNHIVDLATLTDNYEAQDGDILINTLAGNYKISVNADGATVTLKDATITGTNDGAYSWAGITCEKNTTLVIEGANSVTGFCEDYPGIFIASGKTLTIEGNGSLDVSSNGWGAGIGSNDADCGNIVINSGTISATGGIWMAGIGCGYAQNCGYITINGGTVTATGGIGAAGIGTGYGNSSISCGDITINDGTVTATGGLGAAGIGSGFVVNNKHNQCGDISITGGQVTATGGDGGNSAYDILKNVSWANIPYYGGAGIGTGSTVSDDAAGYSDCGTITIGSGVTSVTATKGGGTRPATNSIGKNESTMNQGTCGTITIGGTEYPSGATPNQSDGLTFVYPAPEPTEQIVDLSTITTAYTAVDGDILTGTLGTGVQISIADGATITLRSANINGSDNLSGTFHGLKCLGDATIILENNNNVVKANCGSEYGRAGIFVPQHKTLTFEAGNSSGFVAATGAGEAAGIGGYSNTHCGAIVINSGKVTGTAGTGVDETFGDSYSAGIGSSAYKRCDGITINGGQVIGTAYADGNAAGIGTGGNGICRKDGDSDGSQPAITISNTLSNYVKAQKGSSATYFIGGGPSSKCGIVTVGGTTYEDGGGNRGISSSTSLSYDFTVSGNSLIYMP